MTGQWKILPFDEVISDETGGNIKTLASEFLPEGQYPIVDQGKGLIAGYTNDAARLCKTAPPVIVFGDHTRALKFVDFRFCLGADGTKVLQARNGNDPKYIYHYLNSADLPDAGYSRHFKFLKRIEIPTPSVSEQSRIAAILDQADALRVKRRAALAQLDEMAQAIFLEMFGNPAFNPFGFPMAQLRELGKVSTGATPPGDREGMFGGSIPFVTPGDLGTSEPVRRTVTELGANAIRTVRQGAALVCCIGATIGKMDKARHRSAFNQQINAVEWKSRIADDYGLRALMLLKDTIVSAGTSTTLPILKKSSFEQIKIPVPPMHLQSVYKLTTERLEILLTTGRRQSQALDALFAALQHRAFNGEL